MTNKNIWVGRWLSRFRIGLRRLTWLHSLIVSLFLLDSLLNTHCNVFPLSPPYGGQILTANPSSNIIINWSSSIQLKVTGYGMLLRQNQTSVNVRHKRQVNITSTVRSIAWSTRSTIIPETSWEKIKAVSKLYWVWKRVLKCWVWAELPRSRCGRSDVCRTCFNHSWKFASAASARLVEWPANSAPWRWLNAETVLHANARNARTEIFGKSLRRPPFTIVTNPGAASSGRNSLKLSTQDQLRTNFPHPSHAKATLRKLIRQNARRVGRWARSRGLSDF